MTTGTDDLRYQHGFGNSLSTEAEEGALPVEQNSPHHTPYGLFAEQISGTGFTVERDQNRRTWAYRLRTQLPATGWSSVSHGRLTGDFSKAVRSPDIMRFRPLEAPDEPTDWLAGLTTFAGAGDPALKQGAAIHLYAANQSMERVFCNVDGDLLVIPVFGRLRIQTELGWLALEPSEIAIIPRAIRFRVHLEDDFASGWVGEVFDGHLKLPERGPIGANSLADERHFLAPVAAYENKEEDTEIVIKTGGRLFSRVAAASPFDVVAWHGNYAPFKYDLRLFNALGTVTFDHPDPSINTVLTCQADTHGRGALDFAAFVPRWDVAEHSFRPPYFHRNSAIEFNGVVSNNVQSGPWQAGAFSFTPYLLPHGISASSYNNVVGQDEDEASKPHRMSEQSLWIQFESTYLLSVMPWMVDHPARDAEFLESFDGFRDSDLA